MKGGRREATVQKRTHAFSAGEQLESQSLWSPGGLD